MYHPYFRGKQYDLITVKEMAPVMAAVGFRPIIEPVRETLTGLNKALDAVVEAHGQAIVIVNPHHGDLSGAGESLTELLKGQYLELPNISAGILLKQETTLEEALECYTDHDEHNPVFIHAGFGAPKSLADSLRQFTKDKRHIFLDGLSMKLYQKHFKGAFRVLVKDGFKRQKRNSDYPDLEPFSDLHATFPEEGMDGFGDFLIVGDEFSESGGPAYAVAIHLTFIDHEQDDMMFIYHFKSDQQATPKDPAGKFAEALAKMMAIVDAPASKVLNTSAIREFRALHERGHYPGLGYVKKLSMNHHIETLAKYLGHAE